MSEISCIGCARRDETLQVMDGALSIAADLANALKPLIPPYNGISPAEREKWQPVINAIFAAAEYAEKHDIPHW